MEGRKLTKMVIREAKEAARSGLPVPNGLHIHRQQGLDSIDLLQSIMESNSGASRNPFDKSEHRRSYRHSVDLCISARIPH